MGFEAYQHSIGYITPKIHLNMYSFVFDDINSLHKCEMLCLHFESWLYNIVLITIDTTVLIESISNRIQCRGTGQHCPFIAKGLSRNNYLIELCHYTSFRYRRTNENQSNNLLDTYTHMVHVYTRYMYVCFKYNHQHMRLGGKGSALLSHLLATSISTSALH